jgi:hypothetical protein
MRVRILALAALLAIVSSSSALAQPRDKEPIEWFAADARAALPRFKDDELIADAIGVTTDNLPTWGLGLVVGAHLYPVRGKVSLGLGGEMLWSRARRTPEPAVAGGEPGPTVNTRFRSISPQVSLNFGSRRGWSYLSGGIGWVDFTTELEEFPVAESDTRTRAINYGGGARWFAKEHLAFCFDLRFYRIDAQDAAVGRPAYPGMRLMVLSAGVSVK